jgi:hypothetical protein
LRRDRDQRQFLARARFTEREDEHDNRKRAFGLNSEGFKGIWSGKQGLSGWFVLDGEGVQFHDSVELGNADPQLSLPYTSIAESRLAHFGLSVRLVIRTRDGKSQTFEFGEVFVDKYSAKAALAMIEGRLKTGPSTRNPAAPANSYQYQLS